MGQHFLKETRYNSNNIIHDLKGAVLSWYPFNCDGKILCITSDAPDDGIADMLNRRGLSVTTFSVEKISSVRW